jgi:ribose transport system ATP-binding protein
MSSSSTLLKAEGVSKSYPGVKALQDVALSVERGEVLAVVGENGAGKSTLMKILAGVEKPDAGTVQWEGKAVSLGRVQEAERLGIVLIHQELNLADNLDVASSIFLGREPTWGPLRIIRRSIYPQAQRLMERVGLRVHPATRVSELSIGQQQLVEVARALSLESRLLIMDEPTSSLTETETRTLYGVIQSLKNQGVSILYISHRLKEVEFLADRVVVLRDGRNSGELQKEEIRPERMVQLMVGRDLKQLHQRKHEASALEARTPVLEVRGMRWSAKQPDEGVSFDLAPGEILGLAGLVGAGRTELAEVLFGVRPRLGGTARLLGKAYEPRNPRQAMRRGVFLVPEDRRQEGLILINPVRDNVSLASLELMQRFGLVKPAAERSIARGKVEQLRIRTPSIEQEVGLLSGGNQQKVVIAKGLVRNPKLLILDEPTRGVDVGAKAEIYAIMDELAAQGVGILMISSDLEEVLGMSDRVLVLHEGRLAGELARAELSEERVMHLATGRLQVA